MQCFRWRRFSVNSISNWWWFKIVSHSIQNIRCFSRNFEFPYSIFKITSHYIFTNSVNILSMYQFIIWYDTNDKDVGIFSVKVAELQRNHFNNKHNFSTMLFSTFTEWKIVQSKEFFVDCPTACCLIDLQCPVKCVTIFEMKHS